MIRALLTLWSPSAVSIRTEDEAQSQRPGQAQFPGQIRARWEMHHRSGHISRHPRMIALEMAGRENPSNMLDRVEPNNQQPPAEQDPDLSESEPDEEFFFQAYDRGYSVRRRSNFTMPRSAVDEPVSQPIIWLALEALEKRNRKASAYRNRGSAEFVAQFLAKHLTMEVFNAGNQPGYGPSNIRPTSPPPRPPGVN
ncbi:uncharacterized protein LOC111071845 [Drosophila obscura]|uniref:uncharacterized protein LOC111071845 n=1 Tax=Drosophila obscura TaxID=7282 RepID=UPI000BA07083|nr:uncharacterized protein LOC111071845 [Drosophila obscura]